MGLIFSDVAPTNVTLNITPSIAYTNDNLNCTASAQDADGDNLTLNFSWNKGAGQIFSELKNITADGTNSSILNAGNTTKGETWNCTVFASDAYLSSSPNSTTRYITNSLPSITSVSLTPNNPNTTSLLTCTPSGWSDLDGDTAGYYYAWYDTDVLVSGQTGSTFNCGSVANCDKGDNITCQITPYDGTNNGTALNASQIIVNLPPTIAYTITFANASAGHYFTATAGVNDPDGAADVNFTNISSTVGSCVQISNSSAGNNFNATYNCTDTISSTSIIIGFTDKSAVYVQTTSASNTYPNHAPSITAPNITPASPNKTSTLTCNEGTFSDSDGDTAGTHTWRWFKNNAVIGGQTTQTLTNAYFNKTDVIICEQKPFDQYSLGGTAVNSTSVTIQNIAPTISQQLTFTNATGHHFNVSARANDTDGVSDIVNSNISSTLGICPRISFTTLGSEKQAVYNCTGTALQSTTIQISFNDSSNAYATTNAASNIYPNNIPSITSVSMTPASPNTTSLLTCTPSGWSDLDGDTAGYYYEWYDTDVLVSGQTTSTFNCSSVANCDKGDNITCQVTPYDGYENGTAINASKIIANAPPTLSSISPLYDPIKGDNQQVINAATPLDDDNDTLNFYCCNNTSNSCTPSILAGTFNSPYSNMNWTYDAPNFSYATIYVRCLVGDGTANSSIVST
jgi:hypothetical protein